MTTARPTEFDAAVKKWLPGLRTAVAKLVPRQEREDVMQQTLAHVFERWENFRNDGKYTGFFTWLRWQARGVVSNRRKSREDTGRDFTIASRAVMPNQEHAADLSLALSKLAASERGITLLQYTAGIGQPELAEAYGLSTQAISQRCQRARKDILGRGVVRQYVGRAT